MSLSWGAFGYSCIFLCVLNCCSRRLDERRYLSWREAEQVFTSKAEEAFAEATREVAAARSTNPSNTEHVATPAPPRNAASNPTRSESDFQFPSLNGSSVHLGSDTLDPYSETGSWLSGSYFPVPSHNVSFSFPASDTLDPLRSQMQEDVLDPIKSKTLPDGDEALDQNPRIDLEAQVDDKPFQAEQMKEWLPRLPTKIQAYLCVQFDARLDFLIPGLRGSIGFMGSFNRKTENSCWGLTGDFALGVDYGFQVFDYGLGLSGSFTGTLDATEKPGVVIANTRGEDLPQEQWMYIPEGADPNRCHSQGFKGLWTILSTVVKREYRRWFSIKEVKANLTGILEKDHKFQAEYAKYATAYTAFTNAEHELVNRSRLPVFRRPRVLETFHTIRDAHATGAVDRLANGRKFFDEDDLPNYLPSHELQRERFLYEDNDIIHRPRAVDDLDWDMYARHQKRIHQRMTGGWMDSFPKQKIWQMPKALDTDKAVVNKKLVLPAAAMLKATRSFVGLLPAYADQVMSRLTDKYEYWGGGGFDNERHIFWKSAARKRITEGNGKYMARWPSAPDFEQKKTEHENKTAGLKYKRWGADDRVINFAKVIRLSEHKNQPGFWKEVAISASNLLVRVVEDVKALFSAALGANPEWDGSCESLPISFRVTTEIDEDLLLAHAWISQHATPERRILFAEEGPDSSVWTGVPVWVVRNDDKFKLWRIEINTSRVVYNPDLFPHLWCVLAEKAADSLMDARSSSDEVAPSTAKAITTEVSVLQACVNVARRKRPLEEDDHIRWDDDEYGVFDENGNKLGILWSDRPVCRWCIFLTDDLAANVQTAKTKGFNVYLYEKQIEQRYDCERVRVPKSFHSLFPNFMNVVDDLIVRMEELLLNINICLGEAHNVEKIVASFEGFEAERAWRKERRQCLNKFQTLEYVRDKAEDAIRLVRWFLFQLGAAEPESGAETLPFAWYENSAIENNKKVFANVAHQMLLDFNAALGMGPALEVDDDQMERALNGTPIEARIEHLLLDGYMWQEFEAVKEELVARANPHDRLVLEVKRKQVTPLIEYSTSVVFSISFWFNSFCVPTTAPFIVSYTRATTRQTWSNVEKFQSCWVARIRPGSVFLQISKCNGITTGDAQGYFDWKIRLESSLVGGDLLAPHETGVIGNLLTTTKGALTALIESGVAAAAGWASFKSIDNYAPALVRSPVLSSLMSIAGAGSPAAAVLTAGALHASEATFTATVKAFLSHLADHGIVQDLTTKSVNILPFQVAPCAIIHGTIIHRVNIHDLITENHRTQQLIKTERSVSMDFEIRSIVKLNFAIPFVSTPQVVARADFCWSLTPWYEARVNRKKEIANEQRIARCLACIKDQQAFCDWKILYGSAWEPALDQCIGNSARNRKKCIRYLGVAGNDGKPLTAQWHAPDNASACMLTYVKANKGFKTTNAMKDFFRRH